MRPTKHEFTQAPHCCLSRDEAPLLRMELEDGGGGEFLVLHASHWAMESEAEIDMLAAEMKAMLANANREGF